MDCFLTFFTGANSSNPVKYMPYLDIPEGCVLVGPQNSTFFIFNDRILTILQAMYLVSNNVASN